MSDELRELYQSVIIDHGRHPRNFGAMPDATHHGSGFNTLCGDQIMLHVFMQNNVIEKIQFEGAGCAISMASASLLTEKLRGLSEASARQLFNDFHALVMEGKTANSLGKLSVFAGVREFPVRVKCATLAWHTFMAALAGDAGQVSTEENTV